MGPDLPPPSSIQSEEDVKRAVRELWSITKSATDVEEETGSSATNRQKSSRLGADKRRLSKPASMPCKVTPEIKTATKSESKSKTNTSAATGPSAVGTNEEKSAGPKHPFLGPEHERPSFVVEEMPQICRFQLTLKRKKRRGQPPRPKSSSTTGPIVRATANEKNSIVVSAEPLGRAGARTLVIIRENEHDGTNGRSSALFVGEFPRPIKASEITWRVVRSTPEYDAKNENSQSGDDTGTEREENARSVFVFRLPYPYDPSNTSSLVLGGSLDHSCSSSSSSSSTLDEINIVMCGSCHLPLVIPPNHQKFVSPLATPTAKTTIRRVFPLPQGHWDEIADYLICYDGQPVVDFSGGSQCVEPSIALQDASLLCFHRRDVEKAVCALAVESYGDPTEDSNNSSDAASIDQTNESGKSEDLGTFFAKPPSSSFVLPNPGTSPAEPPETEAEEKKDDAMFGDGVGEPPITATSAVIRGDRRWQDANDGESVSLCCGRCCSLLGFASLGSPETWRFWKHRLSIPKATNERQETDAEGLNNSKSNNTTLSMTFAASASVTTTTEQRLRRKTSMVSLPSTKPLGSCSSFLARELVRYAESKAIFTFVVTSEGPGDKSRKKNNCLLLRLLSWQTAIATSCEKQEIESPSSLPSPAKPPSSKLLFRKVAKIVFEETIDPTVDQATTSGHQSNGETGGAAQWFWGGVDLCCPPPSALSMKQTNSSANAAATTTIGNNDDDDTNQTKAVSTAKLQLPGDEYDRVFEDLMSGRSFFEKETADATILLKMGDLWKGLGLTAVVLE